MKKWHFIIDVAKCENCNNCFLACKDEHCDNDWPGYTISQPLHGQRWMNLQRTERGRFPLIDVAYLPKPCQQCDDAPCIKVSQNGAVYKRTDGIVMIDPQKARGQKAIVTACPFEAVYWNESEQIPQKCTLCAHLIDEGWKRPRCVQACPTGALNTIYLEDAAFGLLVNEQNLETLQSGNNPAKPTVYYRNLYRFNSVFIAGSIATDKEEESNCVPDAEVKLYRKEELIATTTTDEFGDFKFDNLPRNIGAYQVQVIEREAILDSVLVTLEESKVLTTIRI